MSELRNDADIKTKEQGVRMFFNLSDQFTDNPRRGWDHGYVDG